MKRISLSFTILLLLYSISFSQVPVNENNPEITAKEIQDHINYLASDKLEGRFSGSEGENLAAEYIQNEFKNYGLKPFFENSYLQEFPFIAGVELAENNSAIIGFQKEKFNLKLEDEFIPLSFSDNKNLESEVVFAGYGISASDLNYDDYKNIDVKDKIVLVLRHHPEIENPHSKFDQYSDFRFKANTAKEKGAAGIIFFNGFFPNDDEDNFPDLKYDGAPAIKGISAIFVKRDFIESLFKSNKKDLKQIQEKINKNKNPNSFSFENSKAKISTDLNLVEKKARNVAAILEGSDPELKNKYIIIGAHYDHLGYGETGSLYRGKEKQIHNGADDNASGTTGVLELAEKFSSMKDQIKRSIIFIAFSGEELGLLGSNFFVNNSSIPVEKFVTMINMDMIGRMNEENSLTIYGAGTSKIWKDLLNGINSKFNFNISFNDEGFGPSDHSSFYGKQIPVLFFFTGVHTDYHRPSDDAETINSQKQEQVVKFVFETANTILNEDKSPDYVNVPRKDTGGAMRFKV